MGKLGATQLDEAEIPIGHDTQYSITLVWVHYDQNGLSHSIWPSEAHSWTIKCISGSSLESDGIF